MHDASEARAWRLRVRIAGAMAITMLVIGLGVVTPGTLDRGVIGATPSFALVAGLLVSPDNAERFAGELLIRVDAGELPSWQKSLAARAAATTSASSQRPMTRAALAMLIARLEVHSEATSSVVSGGLRDPDARVRLSAVEAARRCERGDEAISIAVLNLARADQNERVRAAAASVSWRRSGTQPEMLWRLAPTLSDPSAHVRERSLYALADLDALNDPATLRNVEHTMSDVNAEVRIAAAWALGRMTARGRVGVDRMAARLTDPSPAVRSAAALSLGDAGVVAIPFRALLVELLLLDDHAEVRAAAREALQTLLATIGR